LQNADQQGQILRHAKCKGTDFTRAKLQDVDFSESDLFGANFHFAKLAGANLAGADMRGSKLRSTNLKRAKLAGAGLREGMLIKAAGPDSGDIVMSDLTACALDGAKQRFLLTQAESLPTGVIRPQRVQGKRIGGCGDEFFFNGCEVTQKLLLTCHPKRFELFELHDDKCTP